MTITAAYHPAIPLLGIDLGKLVSQRHTGTPMITAVLFTIAKTWKQPKMSTDKGRGEKDDAILLSHKKN